MRVGAILKKAIGIMLISMLRKRIPVIKPFLFAQEEQQHEDKIQDYHKNQQGQHSR
jgi:hypothetical protein